MDDNLRVVSYGGGVQSTALLVLAAQQYLPHRRCSPSNIDAGLPVPPKSSCYFCPFHRPATFGDVYLTRFGRPLREVFAATQLSLLPSEYDEDEGHRCGDVCDT